MIGPLLRRALASIGTDDNASAALTLPKLARPVCLHVTAKVLPVPNAGRPLTDVRRPDHSPFWDAGYDAGTVTTTSFLRNPSYRLMSDTFDTLDLPFLAAVTEGLDAALSRLENTSRPPTPPHQPAAGRSCQQLCPSKMVASL